MQKVVKFLEQNVQWMALGIGGLFFLYMIWGWVITPAATVNVAGQQLGPSDVDSTVADKSSQLRQLADAHDADPSVPKTPKDNVQDFLLTMSNSGAPPAQLTNMWNSQPFKPDADLAQVPIQKIPGMNPQPGAVPQGPGKIAALPILPVPEIVGAGGGLSAIQPPQPQSGSVAVIPAALGPNGQPLPIDKAWATVTFKLDPAAISKSFAAANVPLGTKSLVVQVEMVREEQLPDGSWGPDTPVRGIAIPQQVPYPFPGAQLGLSLAYKTWAEGHESDILQPQFYTEVGTAKWLPPGLPTVQQNAQGGQTSFDPANYTGPLDGLTPDQKKAVLDARRAKAIEKAKNAPKPTPRGNGGSHAPGRGGGAGGENPAGAMIKSDDVYLGPPPFRPPQPFGAAGGDMAADNPDMANGGGGGAPPPPGLTPDAQALVQKHPTSSFDPADPQFAGGIICWAHDDAVEPGKTYRYKLHYKMLNPGYIQQVLFVNPKLALQFDMTSDWTPWTQPVDVPAQTTFYVSRNPLGSGVPVEIFHWQNGQLHFKSTTIAIGDMIGGPDGDTDFTSGWTVADIRSDPRGGSTYVLLVDTNGKTIRRDFNSDSRDPKYQSLKQEWSVLKPPPNQPSSGNNPGAAGG